MIKVCFYGAESTGKSQMAKRMATLYQTEFVPEVAREFITTNDFTIDDIIKIGNAQTERIILAESIANGILFCDTDLITTQIYSKRYLGAVPSILFELERQVTYDQYFLFDIDVPWVADGLRNLGNEREEMHQTFKDALSHRKISYTLVSGDWERRFNTVHAQIEVLLKNKG